MKATATKTNLPLVNDIENWKHLYFDDLQKVNQVIVDLTSDSRVPLIGEVANYIIASGGKRLRPILVLLSSKLCGFSGDRHISLAAAIEFIHTATLLHDDVVDESKFRRGNKTANEQWGNAASVLVGDFLLSRAFQLMARDGSLKVLRILSDASATISEGEVNQLTAQNNIDTDFEQYLAIISAKTAKLFSSGCELGPVLNERPENEEKALSDYGQYLGIAFQIVDDILDYSAKQEELGKSIGDDFAEGKVTLPVILAYESANDEEKQFWRRVIEDKPGGDEDLQRAISIMNRDNLLEKSMSIAQGYSQKATNELSIFPECDEKQSLIDLSHFAVNRPY